MNWILFAFQATLSLLHSQWQCRVHADELVWWRKHIHSKKMKQRDQNLLTNFKNPKRLQWCTKGKIRLQAVSLFLENPWGRIQNSKRASVIVSVVSERRCREPLVALGSQHCHSQSHARTLICFLTDYRGRERLLAVYGKSNASSVRVSFRVRLKEEMIKNK